jgi:hypothetical protein
MAIVARAYIGARKIPKPARSELVFAPSLDVEPAVPNAFYVRVG